MVWQGSEYASATKPIHPRPLWSISYVWKAEFNLFYPDAISKKCDNGLKEVRMFFKQHKIAWKIID